MGIESKHVNGTVEHVKYSQVESNSRDSSPPSSSPVHSADQTSPPAKHSFQMSSPKVQTMGHPEGYDPNRIPLSIFSSKPANTSEWSTCSNESLFSIHMGNNSFSTDFMWKSGELDRLDELDYCHSFAAYESKQNEYLPPVLEVSANEENDLKTSNASRFDSNNSLKVPPETPNMTTGSLTAARLSEESTRSSTSFAFPVLVNDFQKTSPMKGVDEKTEEFELQLEESKATQRSSSWRWFSWFSCLPRCC